MEKLTSSLSERRRDCGSSGQGRSRLPRGSGRFRVGDHFAGCAEMGVAAHNRDIPIERRQPGENEHEHEHDDQDEGCSGTDTAPDCRPRPEESGSESLLSLLPLRMKSTAPGNLITP